MELSYKGKAQHWSQQEKKTWIKDRGELKACTANRKKKPHHRNYGWIGSQ